MSEGIRAGSRRALGRRSRSRFGAALLTAVLGAGVVTIAGPVGVAEAGPVYQVVNTGGIGVRLRNSPRINDIKGPGPLEGASFELLCQTTGDAVGARNNRIWNYISWRGQQGYIPDVYANTPTIANQFVPGVPRCGSAPVSPPPVAPTPVPSQPPATPPVVAPPAPTGPRCADVTFIGVRESGSPQTAAGGLGETNNTALRRFRERIGTQRSIESYALVYPAATTSVIFTADSVMLGRNSEFVQSIEAGRRALVAEIRARTARCNGWIVLSGYSQGAMVIRLALAELGNQPRIGGVILFGDPLRRGSEGTFEQIGGASMGLNGVGTRAPGYGNRYGRTTRGIALSYCLRGDGICEFTPMNLLRTKQQGMSSVHAMYNGAPAAVAGGAMANRLLQLPVRPG